MTTGFARWLRQLVLSLVVGGTTLLAGCDMLGSEETEVAAVACPQGLGWAEGLPAFLDADAEFPTAFSDDADDCLFQQWSWEAFAWATAIVDGEPRFLSLNTMEMLDPNGPAEPRAMLRLTPRSTKAHNLPTEDYDGAFVEADGSMLVSQNGYPVYASVHMNDSYFATAKENLIVNGGYQNNAGTDTSGAASTACGGTAATGDPDKSYFECGAAVFKSTWLRLKDGEAPPEGAYVTTAEVPVLKNNCTGTRCTVVATDEYVQAQVALVGLHVVGYVEHHPEFLWATFEHQDNSPSFADGTFEYSDESEARGYTFYAAGTPFSQGSVLVPNQPQNPDDPPLLTFDEATQTFSPITQVVQMNRTGGDSQPNGPANIAAVNQASRNQMQQSKVFSANYFLVGTVWLAPDSYVGTNPDITDKSIKWNTKAIGAVSLANMTAETFIQVPGAGDTLNCVLCHNPKSYAYGDDALPLRRIAISHVLAVDTPFAVPNQAATKPGSGGAAR